MFVHSAPHVREPGIRNPANFCYWNPESTLVWNPDSRRLEYGIQRVEIHNPDAGIRNLETGIRNRGPSWILLHRGRKGQIWGKYQAYWLVLVSLLLYNIMDTV